MFVCRGADRLDLCIAQQPWLVGGLVLSLLSCTCPGLKFSVFKETLLVGWMLNCWVRGADIIS